MTRVTKGKTSTPQPLDYLDFVAFVGAVKKTARVLAIQQNECVMGPSQMRFQPPSGEDSRTVTLFGETFSWRSDEFLGVTLEHRRFSLLGYGDSPSEAAAMLIDRTIALAETLVATEAPTPPLDTGGERLHAYLRGVLRTVESI